MVRLSLLLHMIKRSAPSLSGYARYQSNIWVPRRGKSIHWETFLFPFINFSGRYNALHNFGNTEMGHIALQNTFGITIGTLMAKNHINKEATIDCVFAIWSQNRFIFIKLWNMYAMKVYPSNGEVGNTFMARHLSLGGEVNVGLNFRWKRRISGEAT